jgi:hypothetical protein
MVILQKLYPGVGRFFLERQRSGFRLFLTLSGPCRKVNASLRRRSGDGRIRRANRGCEIASVYESPAREIGTEVRRSRNGLL